MGETALHWIDGAWSESDSGQFAESINPSTGEVIGRFADGGMPDVERAIDAACRAFEESAWAHKPRLRASVLLKFADLMEAHHHELAELLADEIGKPINGAHHEVAAGFKEFRYYAGLTRTIFGRTMEIDEGLYAWLAREPIGVAGIIVPWNAPATLLVRSLAPALAAGCTTVVKAAGQSALITHVIFELLTQVEDVPPGVLNMIMETGSAVASGMVASPEVDVISYTGSTQVGKIIMENAAGTLKRLSLELGGSAPAVVFPDTDIESMIPVVAKAGTVYAGQMCTAASRVIVHDSRVDEVQAKMAEALRAIQPGLARDPQTQLGPMIDMPNRDRVKNLVDEAAQVDEVIVQGAIPDGALAAGSFITPGLVAVRTAQSPMLVDEVFGPVLSINSFTDEAEAIAKANDTRYGLAASVWGGDLQQLQRVATRIKAGTVWINGHNRLMAEAETGGYKESGMGRLHGVEALDSFLQTKHISWEL